MILYDFTPLWFNLNKLSWITDFKRQHCHLIVEKNKNISLQEYFGFFSFCIVVICCDEVIAYRWDCHVEEEGSGYKTGGS